MKRLRDQRDSHDALTARVAGLVASVGPTPESPARMRRIRRRLDQRSQSYSWRALRPLAAFALVFGGAATAAAAYGVAQLVVQGTDTTPSASEVVAAPVATPTKRIGPARTVAAPPSAVAEVEADNADTSLTETDATPVSLPTNDTSHARRHTPSKRAAASEARVVQRGLEALRNEKDPKKAAAYLDEYRRKHPGGALAEEALALSVEAASASGDPRARSLATEYLAQYPAGRFRRAARRALANPSKAKPADDDAPRSEGRKRGQ